MRQDRFGAVDSTEEMDRLVIELLRKKTPEQRFRMVVDRMELTRKLRAATVHLRKPEPHDPQ